MLQIFLTHLSQVCAGEKAEFKIKIVSKREDVCWSIGIVRDTATPGEAWSSMGFLQIIPRLEVICCDYLLRPAVEMIC